MTIKDIARLADVSVTTVSMVINNRDESISAETREKVLQIIKQYNFTTYAKARQSQTVSGRLLGVLIPSSRGGYGDFLVGFEEAAREFGYAVVLCSTGDAPEETQKQIQSLGNRFVDGAAVFLSADVGISDVTPFVSDGFEVVYVALGRERIQDLVAFSSVCTAAKIATARLIELGHRRLALIGVERDAALYADALEGFQTALYDAGIRFHDEFAACMDLHRDKIQDARGGDPLAERMQTFLRAEVTGIVCAPAEPAIYVFHELERCGLHVPRDVSVVALDSEQCNTRLFNPRLTISAIRYAELGRQAAEELVRRVERTGQSEEVRILEPVLLRGESVAPPPAKAKRIVVVGSMHMDVVVHTSHIPTDGESLISSGTITLPGGKGANQAVGVAKLGGHVCAIGCLGGDEDGRALYNSLVSNGVRVSGVTTIQETPTGKAYIFVAQNGENTIVFSRGANEQVTPVVIDQNSELFLDADFCLLSTEIPWETVAHTLELCVQRGLTILMKPAMETPIPKDSLSKITYLIPNEKELCVQVPARMSVEDKAASLFADGVKNVIVTLGAGGCYLHNRDTRQFFPAADFTPVDTTGAADAFIAALAVYLSEGRNLVSAIRFATYAAGVSITRSGVQTAMADRKTLDAHVAMNGGV